MPAFTLRHLYRHSSGALAAALALSLGTAGCRDAAGPGPVLADADAAIVYVRHDYSTPGPIRADLYRVAPDGQQQRPFVREDSYEADPAWSADGHQVAVVRQLPDFANGGRLVLSLWTVDDYGDLTRLPAAFDGAVSPAWSPDGTRLAVFASGALTVINRDGTGAHVVASDAGTRASPQRWSPDGTRILYTRFVGGQSQLWTVAPDGTGAARVPLQLAAASGAWSPDGRRIAFRVPGGTGAAGELGTLYVAGADGSTLTQVTTGPDDDSPTWSPDGTRLAFTRQFGSSRGLVTHVFVVPVAGGEPRDVTPDADVAGEPTWRPSPTH